MLREMTRNNEDIWEFPNVSTKKQRAGWYVPETVQHPAKMATYLVDKIIEEYTKPGDVILDPMGGCGTTAVEAVKKGRNCIVVDYERKFCDLMRKNIDMADKQQTLTPKGKATVIHGDARNLSSLLGEVDQIVFSPPFANLNKGGGIAVKGYEGEYGKDEKLKDRHARRLSEDPNNIDNIKRYGSVDSIVMSPPYKTATEGSGLYKHPEKAPTLRGVCNRPDGLRTSTDPENIDNLKYGSVIDFEDGKQTYLQAMHRVYAECLKVLKQGGYMILVVKNFIRNKKIVDLAGDTVKLCESVGFKHVRTHKRKLTQLSFWIINYRKRYPDAPRVDYEHVLVFQKV